MLRHNAAIPKVCSHFRMKAPWQSLLRQIPAVADSTTTASTTTLKNRHPGICLCEGEIKEKEAFVFAAAQGEKSWPETCLLTVTPLADRTT